MSLFFFQDINDSLISNIEKKVKLTNDYKLFDIETYDSFEQFSEGAKITLFKSCGKIVKASLIGYGTTGSLKQEFYFDTLGLYYVKEELRLNNTNNINTSRIFINNDIIIRWIENDIILSNNKSAFEGKIRSLNNSEVVIEFKGGG
ncbi:hypothetical protein QWY31_16340 [Cytophagales bacterium LB-30]|uniref:Uncharacterized protein n=1 Tax=Shiella aurantiaca TaxID=3058365 RepID=A0ABT8FA62_9BACT|nr:hypothetical protein [Shiella aurantiaca]MDN4167081.1 hypothetical protein [Shiella aurantiaca]